jgi:hypothetical protein
LFFSFPNLAATQLLLTYCNRWIDVNAMESVNGNTALHIISSSDTNDSIAVVKLLINSGAHIDCMNKFDQTPLDVAKNVEIRNLLKTKQSPSRLKCLCARLIVAKKLTYELIWPVETEMNIFLFLHGGLAMQHRLNAAFFYTT